MDYETFDKIYQSNPDIYSKLVDYNEEGITLKLNKELTPQEPKGSGAMERAAKHASTLNK